MRDTTATEDRDLPPDNTPDAWLAEIIRATSGNPLYVPRQAEITGLRHALARQRARKARCRAFGQRAVALPRVRLGSTPTPNEIVGELLGSASFQLAIAALWDALDVSRQLTAVALTTPAPRARGPR